MLLKLNLLLFFYCIFLSVSAQAPVCNTRVFQLQLGSSRAENPSDVLMLPDGYLLAGKDSSAAGVFGRLIKVDEDGKVVVSKEIKMGSNALQIKKLRFISNTLFALGETADNSGKTTPVLMTIDASTLNVLSSTTLAPSPASWHAAAFDQGEADTLSILCYNDSTINVTRVTVDGTVLWSKSYKTGMRPDPVGIVNNYTDFYIAYNTVEGGIHKAVVMRLGNNGVQHTNSVVGGGTENVEYILHSMQMVLGLLYITGVELKDGKAFPFRFTVSLTITLINGEEDFSLSSLSTGLSLRTAQSDWSEVIAAGMPNSSALYLAFTFPLNYNSPISAKKISYPYPVTLKQIIRTADAGSLILAQEAGNGGKIVLTKVDSSGTLPGCGSDTITASFTGWPVETEQIMLPYVTETLQAASVPVTSADLMVTEVADCRSLYCPVIPQPPVCERTFFKRYDNQSHSPFPRQIIHAGNGKLLVAADYRANPYIADDITSLSLFDTAGNVVKNRNLNGRESMYLNKITRLRDGSYMGVGNVATSWVFPYPLGIMKLDSGLNLLWQKKLNFELPYTGFFDLIESSEGDVYCYLRDTYTNIPEKRQLLKVDRDGNPVWFKEYDAGLSVFSGTDEQNGWLVEKSNYIYMTYHPEADWSPHILKISKSDGSIIWDRQYSMGPFLGSNINIQVLSFVADATNLYIAVVGGDRNVLLKVNPSDGSLVSSLLKGSSGVSITGMVVSGKGNLVVSASGGAGKVYGVVEMDTSFRRLQKQFLQLPLTGVIRDVVNYDDSINFAVGEGIISGNPYESYLTLEKYNFQSSFTSCQVTDPGLLFRAITVPVVNGAAIARNLPLPSPASLNITTTAGSLQYQGYYCGNQPLCSSVTISGPAAICDSGIYHYSALKDPGCEAHVNWAVNASADSVEMVAITDTSVDLHITRPGNYQLRAKIFGSCDWIGDSMVIRASVKADHALDLGPDTTLCEGNRFTLNAGGGFSAYRWQDGSTDTSLMVTSAGTYFVTVQGGCDIELTDTVVVAPHAAIPFDVGEDTTVCKGESITLTAPKGFNNYQWTDGNNTNSTTATAIISPTVGTKYTVHADAEAGCGVSDSIFVAVREVPAIHLRNDTSFCQGQFITLDAGEGFKTYEWNTGETTQEIITGEEGMYTVTGFLNGCAVRDSMKVLSVYALPSFSLGADTTLCEGQTISYAFDLQNAGYAWSTGNTGNHATISGPGNYWLTIEQNGCATSDSVSISYQPAPVIDLGSDMTICEGTARTLTAGNNNATYLWQDKSTSPQFTVTSAGAYFVIASLGSCHSSDTIQISVTPLPQFTLGADQYLCMGQTITLTPHISTEVSYLWQDGSTTPTYAVTKEGTYFLTASNSCGSLTDSVTITLGFCDLIMPNAFTPNYDGINDIFRVKYPFPVKSFLLRIYDRFGEKVFESNDIHKGWTGTFKGINALQGAYVWTISLVNSEGKTESGKGIVTLLR